MNKHVFVPALGLLVLGTLSLTACSGGSTAGSAPSAPTAATPVTSQAGAPATSTPAASTPAASTPSAAADPSADADPSTAAASPAPAPTGDAAASAVAAAAGGEATFRSSCDRTDTTQVPVRLHDGKATLPHGSELELDDSPQVTKNVQLGDGHTYRLVTLDCLPPAGASHSQLFVYRADPGSTPRLLGEPITLSDQVRITTTGEQDHEGLVVSAEGWTAKAPGCCPDRSLTYFMTVAADRVVTAPPSVQPLTR